jgi:hypothetical protein
MEINVSNIFNTAIILESRTIEKYLIEEQEKSGHSPEVFFGLLLSHIKQISIEKKIENLNGKVLELTYDLKIFDEEVAPTLSDLSREYNRRKKTEKLEEAKAKATNYELFDEIVNRLWEQSILRSENAPISEVKQPKKQNPPPPPLENIFNKMSIKKVRAIFIPLVETKNRKGEYWMNRKDFEIFIRRSFLGESLAKPNINFNETEKGCIIKLFFVFYTESKKEREITSRLKKPYIELLEQAFNTDAFFNLHKQNFSSRAKCDWMVG